MGKWEMHGNVLRKSLRKQRPLMKLRHGWNDNIKMNYKEVVCDTVEWIHPPQGKVYWSILVNSITNLLFSYKRQGIS
jgi:hypothetical protein